MRHQSSRINRDESTHGASSQLAASTFVPALIRPTRNMAVTRKQLGPTKKEQESNANEPRNCKNNGIPNYKREHQVIDSYTPYENIWSAERAKKSHIMKCSAILHKTAP